jgi:hypothetical protein
VDWKETIKQADDAGIADAKRKVQAVAKYVYEQKTPSASNPHGKNSAREHKQVIDSYRRVEDAKPNCGRP